MVAGFLLPVYATPYGIGSSPDSVVYIVGARSLVRGQGFGTPAIDGTVTPITHHAPFYSVLLAAGEFLGIEADQWARFLNGLLFAGSIFMLFLITRGFSQKNAATRYALILLTAGLFITSPILVEIFSMAWTEGLFIFLFLTSVYLLGDYLDHLSLRSLVLASLTGSLALLTRYAGVSMALAFALVILLFSRVTVRRRLRDALIFAGLSISPLVFWLLRNSLSAGTATSREFVFHPIGKPQIAQALTTLSSWLQIPAQASNLIKGLSLSILLIVLTWLLWRHRNRRLPGTIALLVAYVPVFWIFLVFSLSFLDANTPLDGRILSTVFVSALILIGYLILQAVELQGFGRFLSYGLIVLGLSILGLNLVKSAYYLEQARAGGIGFASLVWRDSELISHIDRYPREIAIYTNVPEPILLYTDRPVAALPKKMEIGKNQVNPAYQRELDEMMDKLADGQAVVVYFNTLRRSNLTEAAEIEKAAKIQMIGKKADGVIYGIPDLK